MHEHSLLSLSTHHFMTNNWSVNDNCCPILQVSKALFSYSLSLITRGKQTGQGSGGCICSLVPQDGKVV